MAVPGCKALLTFFPLAEVRPVRSASFPPPQKVKAGWLRVDGKVPKQNYIKYRTFLLIPIDLKRFLP